LLDALDRGFCSIEADIYLVDGQLLVAHERQQVKPERTLQALYLDPLKERAQRNGGRIYPGGPPVILLVDIKTEAEATYAALREALKTYSDLVTSFSPEGKQQRAIDVILSGNRPRQTVANEKNRQVALDGRLEDLDQDVSTSLIPLISDNWNTFFKWKGSGPIPDQEKQHLKQILDKAHQRGFKVRFWATADRLPVWRELYADGVDWLSTDDLQGIKEFLTGEYQKKKE
jgi:glycerophosphoryl diester phosphodiesterase